MGRDMAWAAADGGADVGAGEVGPSVPPAQLRALLIIGGAGGLNLSRLALALGASASAASRLCDRMQAAGLLTRDRASASRREIVLVPTESGRRLAEWVRGRRRAALGEVLAGMSPDGREALAHGLAALAGGLLDGLAGVLEQFLGPAESLADQPLMRRGSGPGRELAGEVPRGHH